MSDAEELKVVKEFQDHKPPTAPESVTMEGEELKLVQDVEEVKSNLREFESKLDEVNFQHVLFFEP